MSLSLADAGNLGVNDVDLGVQIGTDGTGGLGVFKRIDAASNAGGTDINVRLTNGLPINTPVTLTMRVVDFNADATNFNSSYEILVNGALVDSGQFRFNGSTTARYLIFDVAAHEGPVHYDNFQLTVTDSPPEVMCRRPILNISEFDAGIAGAGARLRLHWTAQPGLTVVPEWSTDMAAWTAATNSSGLPLTVTTIHGTIQWLNLTMPWTSLNNAFVRLRRE